MSIGLKTISVKTLALSARCLQLVVHILPAVKQQFLETLPDRNQETVQSTAITSQRNLITNVSRFI